MSSPTKTTASTVKINCSNCRVALDKPLRCKACKLVSYCSRECQKSHWKESHSKHCSYIPRKKKRTSKSTKHSSYSKVRDDAPTAAARATHELNSLLSNMSMNEMNEHYHKSMDQVEVELSKDKMNERMNQKSMPHRPSEGTLVEDEKEESVAYDRNSVTNGDLGAQSKFLPFLPAEDSNVISGGVSEHKSLNPNETRKDTGADTNIKTNTMETLSPWSFSSNGQCEYSVEKLFYTSFYTITMIFPKTLMKAIGFNPVMNEEEQLSLLRRNMKITINKCNNDSVKSMVRIDLINDEDDVNTKETTRITRTKRKSCPTLPSTNHLASIALPDFVTTNESDVLSCLSIYHNNSKSDDDDNKSHDTVDNEQKTFLMFRLQYSCTNNSAAVNDDMLYIADRANNPIIPLTNKDALNNVQCRFCHLHLRRNTTIGENYEREHKQEGQQLSSSITSLLPTISRKIQNVFHLPNSYWDEIADYLVCYEGQATVNFASSGQKIEPGIAFEDEVVVVMNKQDLPNICILAIEGYGDEQEIQCNNHQVMAGGTKTSKFLDTKEDNNSNDGVQNDNGNIEESKSNGIAEYLGGGALFRGKRTWRDAVGGATVCCNQCCSILGFASVEEPDTCRLLKHRLSAKGNSVIVDNDQFNLISVKDWFSCNTSASFIARELVRYAEAQAVFTFVIFDEEAASNRALLLKLLSWNSSMGFVTKNDKEGFAGTHDGALELRRIAKVVFEEVDDPKHYLLDSKSSNATDPMSFSWDFDLCCPPFGKTSQKKESIDLNGALASKASVHIHLPTDDWKQLREEVLQGRQFIPNSISEATVLMKLGKNGEVKKGQAALSILQLPFS